MKRFLSVGFVVMGCSSQAVRSPTPIVFPFAADTNRLEGVADGVTRRFVWSSTGPWAIHVLDVDLSRCYSAISVKGADGAAGRRKTSELLAALSPTRTVVGGVNADFFALSGFQGVPGGALISQGRVITGPIAKPVLAIDSAGMPRALTLATTGAVSFNGATRRIDGWNSPVASGLALFDAAWGRALDTATSVVEVVLEGRGPSRVVSVDTGKTGASIPSSGAVLVAGRSADAGLRAWLLSLKTGDTLRTSVAIGPFHPLEAVGGRPILVRDSAIAPDVETEGQPSFRGRNPRTAVGIANNGRRLILVVVDGRRQPYSDGVTLRELAVVMMALGSRDAVNLDGGGSSAMVYADPASKSLRLANRPSDATGERAVGDALAIVRGCGRRD